MKTGNFIEGLFARKAQWVLFSSLIVKLSGLLLSLIVVRFLSVEEYGFITLYKTIFLFLTPLIGLGLNHSLLRYGALSSDRNFKIDFFFNTILFGTLISFLIGGLVFFLLPFVPNLLFNSTLYISALIFYQALFLLNSIFNFYRVLDDNKTFSLASTIFSIVALFCTCVTVFYVRTPSSFFLGQFFSVLIFIVGLLYFNKSNIKSFYFGSINMFFLKFKYVKYGFSVALGTLASQLMLASDNIMLSVMGISIGEIGLYGVCSLIFINILFIPSIIMVTDFVYLSNLPFSNIKKYLFDYWRLIFIPLITICIFFVVWGDFILGLVFGEAYYQAGNTLKILTLGIFFGVMFRVPVGNLLNAKGLSTFNVLIAVVFCIVNIGLNYLLIPLYGINGAALATGFTISISSLISLLYLILKLRD